jgi:hypothetical protein
MSEHAGADRPARSPAAGDAPTPQPAPPFRFAYRGGMLTLPAYAPPPGPDVPPASRHELAPRGPGRTPDWRWRLAGLPGRTPRWAAGDPWLRRLRAFRRAGPAARPRRDPDLAAAWALRAPEATPLRAVLEARLLAGQGDAEIAHLVQDHATSCSRRSSCSQP